MLGRRLIATLLLLNLEIFPVSLFANADSRGSLLSGYPWVTLLPCSAEVIRTLSGQSSSLVLGDTSSSDLPPTPVSTGRRSVPCNKSRFYVHVALKAMLVGRIRDRGRCYRNVGPPEWWSYRSPLLGTVVLGPTILEMWVPPDHFV